jgi:UDP-N-acetylglucosamine:LPS N-acetylglucosamine transferase
VVVRDDELGTQLVPVVQGLLADGDRRAVMSRAARALARPDAAQRIGGELKELSL